VAISNAFGPNRLTGFTVWTDEVSGHQQSRLLTVRHLTVYRYSEAVEFGEHRMMFRPRETCV
jgi:hypothetical protein